MVEPTIINVRSSGSADATAIEASITDGLEKQGFIALNVQYLVDMEITRQTDIGRKIKAALDKGKEIDHQSTLVVDILKRIIYSGIDSHNKFLLIGFHDQIEQASVFENHCATISAIVYATAKG